MPKLYLIPNSISENPASPLAPYELEAVKKIRIFFVEEPKRARHLIRSLWADFPLQECQWLNLNEHTLAAHIEEYANLLIKNDTGIISEAGCPCIADPGTVLVRIAHEKKIDIVPLIGPSSILMALMSSGLNGQNFAFNGYLPKTPHERSAKIRFLEKRAHQEGQTQIVMDTPYRNQDLLHDLLDHCDGKTHLCIAYDITGKDQSILTRTVGEWRKINPQLPKCPALFIFNK